MLYIVLLTLTVSKGCLGSAKNSNHTAASTIGAEVEDVEPARRSANDLVTSLRRQLMKDNYDYQAGHSDYDRPKPKQRFHYQRGAPQVPRSSYLPRADNNTLGTARDLQYADNPYYPPESQYTQTERHKNDPTPNYNQDPGQNLEFDAGQNQEPGHDPDQGLAQVTQNAMQNAAQEPEQDPGPEPWQEDEQDPRQQTEQGPDQYSEHYSGQRPRRKSKQDPVKYPERKPNQDSTKILKQRYDQYSGQYNVHHPVQYPRPEPEEYRAANTGQDPGQKSNIIPRADHADTQNTQNAQTPDHDDLRDMLGFNYSSDKHENLQHKVESYEPSYYNKPGGGNRPGLAQQSMQVAPVRSTRGNFKRQPVQDKDEGDVDQLDAEYPQDAQTIASRHGGLQAENEAEYHELSTRSSRKSSTTYTMSRAPRNLNISKRDLLYYMDDDRLRRRNDVSEMTLTEADDDDEEEEVKEGKDRPRISGSSSESNYNRGAGASADTSASRDPPAPTQRSSRSILVTVAPGNVTYKLLTVRPRSGRRSGVRRVLEERAPGGVALVSLDHASLPALRLPRARRQYMHQHTHTHQHQHQH